MPFWVVTATGKQAQTLIFYYPENPITEKNIFL